MISISRRLPVLLITVLALLPSCTPPNTKLDAMWRDQNYRDHPKKILVIAVLPNPVNRRLLEDVMEKQFKAEGTVAASSYGILSDLTGVDRDKVIAVMNGMGAETVMVIRLTDRKTAMNYMPGFGSPGIGFSFTATSGDYAVRDEFAVVQTNLYDLKTNMLIWTAVSETWMIDKGEQLMNGYARAIMKQLTHDKMLAPRPSK